MDRGFSLQSMATVHEVSKSHTWLRLSLHTQHSIVCICYIFFIHSSIDGCLLHCFHTLAIVTSAAVNIGVHISFQIHVFMFSRWICRSGTARSYGSSILFFFFLVISILFSIVAAPIYSPVNGVQVFSFLQIFSNIYYFLSTVQSLNRVRLFAIPWTTVCQAFLSITNSWSLLKLMSIESLMPSNRLILCYSLLLPPSTFPSIRVFSDESVLCLRWPKYWSFSFSISPSSAYSDWFPLGWTG